MSEMIDKQKVLEIAMSYCPDDDGCCSKAGHDIREMLDEIEALSTIEVKPVQKPKMSETDRKKCEEWCKDCEHIEMCAWYPFGGCDFKLLPEIEAEPVKHGRWIQSDALDYIDPNGVTHIHGMCSCCKRIYNFGDMTRRYNFCPNCGARMDLNTPTKVPLDEVDSVMMGDADND